MTEKDDHPIRVDASPVKFGLGSMSLDVSGIEVIPADRIEVEPAKTPQYLGIRSGYIEVCQRVFVTISGKRILLTTDTPPEGLTPPAR